MSTMLRLTSVHGWQNTLTGHIFMKRALGVSKGRANRELLKFYSKKENWELVPRTVETRLRGRRRRISIDWIVFPDTMFIGDDKCRRVWILRVYNEVVRKDVVLVDFGAFSVSDLVAWPSK